MVIKTRTPGCVGDWHSDKDAAGTLCRCGVLRNVHVRPADTVEAEIVQIYWCHQADGGEASVRQTWGDQENVYRGILCTYVLKLRLRVWGLKVVLSCVSRVPKVQGKKWQRILCRALTLPQYEWANCIGDPKFQNLYWYNGGELGIIHGQSGDMTRQLMWTSARVDQRKMEGYAN